MNIIEGSLSAANLKFAIIMSRFNEAISSKLLEGALDCLKRHNCRPENIDIIKIPGAFEIPVTADKAATSKKYDAVICLGAVIKGATPHFEYVASSTSNGIMKVSIKNSVPVIFGVLTTDNIEQAIERAGTKSGNKGWDAALTAIEMADLFKRF
ncbi:MAG TPA: 6,7-dimethyl-8-ribityllumazine synthase [Ignavibacteriaceae bacterium]|nr:6,7-dimethyl-8-ribityllumazine synthase [Ignavibacteriaceae bacterium]